MQDEYPNDDKNFLIDLTMKRMLLDANSGWKFYNRKSKQYSLEKLKVPFLFAKVNNYGYRTYSFLHYVLANETLAPHLQFFLKHFKVPLNSICDEIFSSVRFNKQYHNIEYGTPLQTAVRFANVDAVNILCLTESVDKSVNADILIGRWISSGNNLVHLAVHSALISENPRGEDVLSLLLLTFGLGEMINYRNGDGDTPFHLVLKSHSNDPILADRLLGQMLLCGADLSMRDGKNKSIFDYECLRERKTFLTQRIYDTYIRRFLSPDSKSILNISQIFYDNRLDGASPGLKQEVERLTHSKNKTIRPTAVQASNIEFKFKSKSVVFDGAIPDCLAGIANKHNYGSHRNSGNYIIVAITVISSDGPYRPTERAATKKTTFLLGGDHAFYKCDCDDDDFTGKIAHRLLGINAKSSGDYLQFLNDRDNLYLNEDTQEFEASSYHSKYMHSEGALLHYLESESFVNTLIRVFTSSGIEFGTKIYGMLYDIVSTKEVCLNACDDHLIALQNSRSRKHGFLRSFEKTTKFKNESENGDDKFYVKRNFALQVRFSYFNERHERYPLTQYEGNLCVDPREDSTNSHFVLNKLSKAESTGEINFVKFSNYCPTVFRSGSKVDTLDAVKFSASEAREPVAKKGKY